MGNDVFANGREVSCKSGSGKTICAFPDVCMTPPENPATPPGVPIPYPNTGMAKDTTSGSKTVKISKKEVTLKNKSYFKKSTGDEAGCAAKKGIITSVNRGKVYFNAWSMDVKVEGENAVRHLDITTHNHASFPGNSPTWPFLDAADFAGSGECAGLAQKVTDNCLGPRKRKKLVIRTKHRREEDRTVKRKESIEAMCANKACATALKCVLSPYSPSNCCPQPQPSPPETTPHHVVPKSQFKEKGTGGKSLKPSYNPDKAPCICVEGQGHSDGKHGRIHAKTNAKTKTKLNVDLDESIPEGKRWTCTEAERVGAEAVEEVTGCDAECTKAQLRKGHLDMDVKANDKVRPTTPGVTDDEDNDSNW